MSIIKDAYKPVFNISLDSCGPLRQSLARCPARAHATQPGRLIVTAAFDWEAPDKTR